MYVCVCVCMCVRIVLYTHCYSIIIHLFFLLQLNTHVLFQCSGEYQMMLRFSCHGQMHRFPVGLKPEFIDSEHKNEAFWV